MNTLDIQIVIVCSLGILLLICLLIIQVKSKEGEDPISVAYKTISSLLRKQANFPTAPDSQSRQGYEHHNIRNGEKNPRYGKIALKPIQDSSTNYECQSRYKKYNKNNALLFLSHGLSFFASICLRVYRR